MKTLLIQSIARILFLPMWMVALGILLKGYREVGDGFSAGVLAALSVSLRWLAEDRGPSQRVAPQKALFVCACGLGLALAVRFLPIWLGHSALTHFPGPDREVTKVGSVELHTAAALDFGIFLLTFGACQAALLAVGASARRPES